MKPVVEVENLSKKYRLQSAASRTTTLRDALANALRAPFGRTGGTDENNVLWALRDVSFAVGEGETLGVIGRNGAGKSTLLKILSRITKPSSGKASIRGRVGSLLEVGTGFHQELSGRENIFLSGSILGMRRREIEKKFDEIIAFAEIESFLEMPVKHYSSGMFMRLAFSVAAHLETEVLLMDEVLAVGDVDFQHKCLNKMREIRRSGRTILFVSHNMSAIASICSRSIALSKGRVVSEGATAAVLKNYLTSDFGVPTDRIYNETNAPANEFVRLRRVRVVGADGQTVEINDIRRPVGIEATFEVLQNGQILIPNFHFFNQERLHLFAVQDVAGEWRRRPRARGEYVSTAWIPGNFLAEGSFVVGVNISSHTPATRIHIETTETVGFEVVDSMTGDTARGDYGGAMPGVVRPLVEWTNEFRPKKI